MVLNKKIQRSIKAERLDGEGLRLQKMTNRIMRKLYLPVAQG